MIHFMHVAIEEAEKRHMYVVLYDEGMYPSGSSSGQVVQRNKAHAAQGLFKIDLQMDLALTDCREIGEDRVLLHYRVVKPA